MPAGLCTGLLHTRCGIPAILAGILTQLALYSVNLRIMTGKANQPIGVDKYDLLVSQRYVRELALNNPIPLVILFLAVLIGVLYWFFGTEYGSSLRATGANQNMARAQGIDTKSGITFGSALAMVISYTTWHSVGWAIVHGLFSWVYVVYFVLRY